MCELRFPKKISTIKSLVDICKNLNGWIFRGQQKKKWHLLPKIGRDKNGDPIPDGNDYEKIKGKEIELIRQFRLKLPAYGYNVEKKIILESDLDLKTMFLAQHYGLIAISIPTFVSAICVVVKLLSKIH